MFRPSRLLTKTFAVTMGIIVAVVLCDIAARTFIETAFREPRLRDTCKDRRGVHRRTVAPEQFYTCADANAKRFVTVNYVETKDLAKTFLTLLTAVFVGSITFSEKIINLREAGWLNRGLIVLVWFALLASITMCGCGLAFMTLAAGQATHRPELDYTPLQSQSSVMFILSGLSFGAGLILMMLAAIVAMIDTPARRTEDPAPAVVAPPPNVDASSLNPS